MNADCFQIGYDHANDDVPVLTVLKRTPTGEQEVVSVHYGNKAEQLYYKLLGLKEI